MLLIRPVREDDVDALVALASHASFGLTTLPRDRGFLERRVREAERGFARAEDQTPRGEPYLFVMEEEGQIIGTSGITSKVGGFEPFYSYRIETSVHESKMLNIRKQIRTLHLVEEHDGPCEIGSLFLHPRSRGGGRGRALSLVRFLFMAERPALFDKQVIAEMRGVIDDRGGSAFWEAVGRHFFDLELPTADYLSLVNKQFIADLMPRHPIYIPLLPAEAQAVIGCVHDETRGALSLLEGENFTFCGMVDIFEAGPVVRCERDRIRSVRDSRVGKVGAFSETEQERPGHLISTGREDFRATMGTVSVQADGTLSLSRQVAETLNVEPGATVRYVSLKGEKTDSHALSEHV